jgi:hypothetical protein
MKRRTFLVLFLALAAVTLGLLSAPAQTKAPADGFKQVPRMALDVTDGKVEETRDGFLNITSPEVRATQQQAKGAKAARVVFTYHGTTKEESKLASGAVAHQFGLKLRAKNTCNLLYVMWKFEDKERINVSVKRNPGKSTHKECGANGYTGIKATFEEKTAFPSAMDGKPHTLEAAVSKPNAGAYELVVKADTKIVWKGSIEAKMLDDIDGPAGFRSDNASVTFKFFSQTP